MEKCPVNMEHKEMSFTMENCQKPVGRQFLVVNLYFLFAFIFGRKKPMLFCISLGSTVLEGRTVNLG